MCSNSLCIVTFMQYKFMRQVLDLDNLHKLLMHKWLLYGTHSRGLRVQRETCAYQCRMIHIAEHMIRAVYLCVCKRIKIDGYRG